MPGSAWLAHWTISLRSGPLMAANSSSPLLHTLLQAIQAIENTRAKGTAAWDQDRRCVDRLLTALQTADGAPTSDSLLKSLSETVDNLIKEFDKQKDLFSRTSSELWHSLSAANLKEAVDNFNVAEQKYRKNIEGSASENKVQNLQLHVQCSGWVAAVKVFGCQELLLLPQDMQLCFPQHAHWGTTPSGAHCIIHCLKYNLLRVHASIWYQSKVA